MLNWKKQNYQIALIVSSILLFVSINAATEFHGLAQRALEAGERCIMKLEDCKQENVPSMTSEEMLCQFEQMSIEDQKKLIQIIDCLSDQ